MAQILVFGDSIAWGAWDKEGGWVARLRKFVDERTLSVPEFWSTDLYMVYNLGISGDTSKRLLERIEYETRQRLKEDDKLIFVFSIGGNDSSVRKNNFFVSPDDFRKNLRNLISVAQKFSSEIFFVGLMPVDETKTSPVSWNTEAFYKNEHIKQYNEIIKSACAENKIQFIDIYGKFSKTDYKNLLEDGLHPNSEGHKLIFEIVKDFLVRNKII